MSSASTVAVKLLASSVMIVLLVWFVLVASFLTQFVPFHVPKPASGAGLPMMAVDSSGGMHFVYGEGMKLGSDSDTGLLYTTNSGSDDWTTHKIVSGQEVKSIAAVSDANDGLHVAYICIVELPLELQTWQNMYTRSVAYAHKIGSQWHTETVYSSPKLYYECSIAVAPGGSVHISYVDNGEVMYAWNSSGSWQTESLAAEPVNGRMPDIAVDSSGSAHVSFYDNKSLMYGVRPQGGPWELSRLRNGTLLSDSTSIAVDSAGRPLICFFEEQWNGSHWLVTSRSTGDAWNYTEVVGVSGVPVKVDAVLGAGDRIHMCYIDGNLSVKYACLDGEHLVRAWGVCRGYSDAALALSPSEDLYVTVSAGYMGYSITYYTDERTVGDVVRLMGSLGSLLMLGIILLAVYAVVVLVGFLRSRGRMPGDL